MTTADAIHRSKEKLLAFLRSEARMKLSPRSDSEGIAYLHDLAFLSRSLLQAHLDASSATELIGHWIDDLEISGVAVEECVLNSWGHLWWGDVENVGGEIVPIDFRATFLLDSADPEALQYCFSLSIGDKLIDVAN